MARENRSPKVDFKLPNPNSQKDEELFKAAVMAVWAENKASTSFVQRRLAIGYNKAARLLERMEELAIVTPANHIGKRTVRSPEELKSTLAVKDTLEAIAGEDLAPAILKAICHDLKFETDAIEEGADASRTKIEAAARKGRPPMKADPDFKEHNQTSYRVTADELRAFIERVERLETEKKDIADGIKEVMSEAKGRGYDTKVMKKIIAERKRDRNDVAEEQAVMEMYREALGMA